MSRDWTCSLCGRVYMTRHYVLPAVCPDCDPDHPEREEADAPPVQP